MEQPAQVAIVTGAGSGIGRAVALHLVSEPLVVIAVGRRLPRLLETVALAARSHGPGMILPVAADVGSKEGRRRIVRTAQAAGTVRYLVHGAGVFTLAPLADISDDAWHESIATNLHGRLFLTRSLLGVFSERARVLFVGSRSGRRARQGAGAYCVSQAASTMLCQCLQKELAPAVLVSTAIPGSVDTHIIDVSVDADADLFPDGMEYRREKEQGLLVAPATVGRFFRWLLLDTSDEDFVSREWELQDVSLHPLWKN